MPERDILDDMEQYGMTWESTEFLHDNKYFDIDISCSDNKLKEYVGTDRIIGFQNETLDIINMLEKIEKFCELNKEYKTDNRLLDFDFSSSNPIFIGKANEHFENKLEELNGLFCSNSIIEIEEFVKHFKIMKM